MTFRTPSIGRIRIGRSRLLIPVIVVLVVLVILFLVFTSVWTNLLWYRSVGFSSVYTKQLWTKILLYLGSALIMAFVVGANVVVAHRVRPGFRPPTVEQQGLDRYRAAIDPRRRLVLAGVLIVVALITGSSVSGRWRTWLAFFARVKFGVKDPEFNKDISFFVFTYPFLRLILGFLFATVILSFLASLVVHYLYGGLRLQGPGERVSPAARAHLSVLLGVFVLLKAVAYWFDRWGLAQSERGVVTGPSYTDVNAVLPAKTILAVIALICAIMFFANLFRRGAMLPGVAFGLLVLSAILVGGVYPLLIQTFQVKPNEVNKESKYIARNIHATRDAYGVANTSVTDYNASTKLTPAQEQAEAATVPNVRLLDPSIVSPTYQQLQQIKGFYRFPDPLDIDRYPDSTGTLHDTVVAVREMAGPPAGQVNWINSHLVYTHGYGFVAAPGNTVDSTGAPAFTEKGIPPSGTLTLNQPRVYFGQLSSTYSIVGGSKTPGGGELDYPSDTSATGQVNNSYDGSGGVPVGSFFNQLLYAVKFKEKNILLSGSIGSKSKILYDRTPIQRVQKAAPWLTTDGDPYPAVVDGKIVWIIDGYTTTDNYPYSQRTSLSDATRDTNTDLRQPVTAPGDQINYIRNSVKATVDAYNGTVKLYAWNPADPVLKTWMKVFPGTVQPRSAISPALMAHLRYPQDLYKVQRQILSKYHVQNAQAFYGGQGFWQVPDDPTNDGNTQPPYYLTLKMPDEQQPGFALTSTYVPKGRPNLAAFMAVDSVPTDPTFGQLQILQVPSTPTIAGPGQVQNTFEADPAVSQQLTLLRQGGSKVVTGNLLTLPFGGGLLYVEPVYVQSAGGESYPLLQRVLVSYGSDIGFASNLQDALSQVLNGTGATTTTPPTTGTPPVQVSDNVKAAIAAANTAFNQAQAAYGKGDWAAYGKAQQDLKNALAELANLQAQAAKPPAKTSPSPAASPKPSG